MANLMRDGYLDPFAARNLGTQPPGRVSTLQSPGRVIVPPAASDSRGIRWWIEQYEAAGRALGSKQY